MADTDLTIKITAQIDELQAQLGGVIEALKGISDNFKTLNTVSKDTANQLQAVATASGEAADASNQSTSAADKFIAKLKDMNETFGLSRTELLTYKAAQLELSEMQSAQAAEWIASLQEKIDKQREETLAAADAMAVKKQVALAEMSAATAANNFVNSLKAEADAIGKTRIELLELRAATLGVSDAVAPFITRLREEAAANIQSAQAGKENYNSHVQLRNSVMEAQAAFEASLAPTEAEGRELETLKGHADKARGSIYELTVVMHELSSGRIRQALSSTTILMQKIGAPIGAALAFAAVATGALIAAKEMAGVVDAYEKIGKASQETGLAVTDLQYLSVAATLTGTKTDQLVTGMGRLDVAFARARAGSKQQADGLQSLGFNLNQNYTATQMLQQITEGWSNVPGPRKATVATEAFGKAGLQLIPAMDMLSQKHKELEEASDRMGVKDQEAVARGVQLADSYNLTKVGLQGLGNVMMDQFGSGLKAAADGTNTFIAALIRSYREGGMFKQVLDFIGDTVRFVTVGLGIFFRSLGDVASSMGRAAGTSETLSFLWMALKETLVGVVLVVDAVIRGIAGFAEMISLGVQSIWPWIQALGAGVVAGVNFAQVFADILRGDFSAAAVDAKHGMDTLTASLTNFGERSKTAWDNANAGFNRFKSDMTAGFATDMVDMEKLLNPAFGGAAPKMPTLPQGDTSDDPAKAAKAEKGDKNAKWLEEQRRTLQAELEEKKLYGAAALAYEVTYWSNLEAGARGNAERMKLIEGQEYAAKKQLHAEAVRSFDATMKAQVASVKAAATEQSKAELAPLQEEMKAVTDAENKKVITRKQASDAKKHIIEEETLSQINAILRVSDAELQQQRTIMALSANGKDPVAYQNAANAIVRIEQETQNKLDALRATATAKEKAVDDAALTAKIAAWRSAADQIGNSMRSTMEGLIEKTTSWSQVWVNVQRQMLDFFLKNLQTMATNWLQHLIFKDVTQKASATDQAATDWWAATQSVASVAWAGIKNIATWAYQAAAATYASIASIVPFGPILAPAMAAAALAAVIGFGSSIASASGGWGDIPQDQMAMVHKNEMILPASIASPLRASLSSGGLPSAAQQASMQQQQAPQSHVHFNITAMDSKSFQQQLAGGFGEQIIRHLQTQRRNMKLGV